MKDRITIRARNRVARMARSFLMKKAGVTRRNVPDQPSNKTLIERASAATGVPVPEKMPSEAKVDYLVRVAAAFGFNPSAEMARQTHLAEKRQADSERRRAAINERMARPVVTRPDIPAGETQEQREARIQGFYTSWEWSRARYDALKRRGARCECCGATREHARIVVDHIKPIRLYWALRLDPANLQVLCDPCNMGKGSRDQTDWRAEAVPLVQ